MKALLLGLFFGLSFAEAKVEAFSNLADSIRKKEINGQVLLLNGIGIHRRFVFNIYRLSLYVPNPSTKPEELINSEEIKFAEMQFLRDIGENELKEAFADTFRENCDKDCETLGPSIARLLAAIPAMKEGTTVEFIFYPTESVIKGFDSQSMRFDGPEFGRFFMRAWLGENPPSSRFKRELLNTEHHTSTTY